ncbi:MAG: RNA-binding S4 domain-containing protein [Rhodospirillales bacterium]|jgi:ribosome-associated heat shock protein Hsp15|nr:RNA-binding S4 domain-containing protein [Rhodospirillales bacterium]MDP6805638.1 RNA-binding S4 domain-containing protein [Rhodospirillales bacterium]
MTASSQRLDRWLWCARFFKSRAQATRFCASGRLRVNGTRTAKAHFSIRTGDVLTFPLGHRVYVIRVDAIAARRGPASEARILYESLEAADTRSAAAGASARDL